MSRMTTSDWDIFAKWFRLFFPLQNQPALCKAHCLLVLLKDKSRVGIINATKGIYHPLTRILTFVSQCELSNGCQLQKCFDSLGHIWFLCRHFLAIAHDEETSSD